MVVYAGIILMIISIILLTLTVFTMNYNYDNISIYIFLIGIIIGLIACCIFIYYRTPRLQVKCQPSLN